MDTKHKGAASELLAASALLQRGYEVYRNLSAHGEVDLMAEKDGRVERFDVKTAAESGHRSRLTVSQIERGVRAISVFPDGECRIEDEGCGIKPPRLSTKSTSTRRSKREINDEALREPILAARAAGHGWKKIAAHLKVTKHRAQRIAGERLQ